MDWCWKNCVAVLAAPEPRGEGKRRRSTVQRFSAEDYTTQKELVVPEGSGTKLGDIPYGSIFLSGRGSAALFRNRTVLVDAMLSKSSVDDLKKLHQLVFGRIGTVK